METQQLTMFKTFTAPRWSEIEPDVFLKRSQIPASLLSAEATTLGWDTVNAVRMPVVNQTLIKSDLYPKTFDKQIQEASNWQINGKFGPWQLVRGGSGSILFMRIPIIEGHMTFLGQKPLDFTNGYVSISIKLEYLPQPLSESFSHNNDNGNPQYLARDANARSVDDPAVVLQAVDYGTTVADPTQDALFKGAISIWFNANIDQFTYIFTVVNINALAAKDTFQWLKPTYTSYAYFNGSTDDKSYFGILNMTSDDSPEGLSNQLPPSAIPADCNASLLVSSEKFLRNMVLPGLRKAFTHATESNFLITHNNTIIEKTGDDIRLDDIKVGAINYTPYLQEFTYQIIGDEIQINNKVHVNVSPGIDVYITGTSYYGLKLVDKPDGSGKTIDFYATRPAKSDHTYTLADWIIVTEIIIGVIGAVASTVAGKVIESLARRIVAIIIISVVAGIIAAIPAIIAKVMDGAAASELPPIGPMVADATSDIEWPDATGFDLISAQLNGSLQLGGNIQTNSNF